MRRTIRQFLSTFLLLGCTHLVWAAPGDTVSAPASVAASSAALPKAAVASVSAASAPTATGSETVTRVEPSDTAKPLDTQIQEVKRDAIALNRDLLVLEEELLFPANTQIAVFVSMDVGKMFVLDSVQIKIDDKQVAAYLYTPLEVQALHRGGVQRLYLGNLRTGDHELVAYFTGGGPHLRDYKRGASIKFTKDTQAKYLELRIRDSMNKLQPEFDIKLWQ
jgi:hypothetical protein